MPSTDPNSAAFAVRRPLMMSAPMCVAGRWHGCFDTENGVLLMTLVALPLAALVVWALARRRRAAGVISAWRMSLAEVGMVYGTVPFVWMTMMPGPGAGIVPGRVSLVPLRDLVTMGPVGIGGNLLIFAALGFFAPMRFAALASVPRIQALGAGCSALVETAQYVLRLDRVSSVDDVLVNATGAVLAGLAGLAPRHRWRSMAEVPSDQPRPALRRLVLRLSALDRRRGYARPPVREIPGLRLDPFRREVFRDERHVALTRKQVAVLEVLVAAEGGVVSAEELLERAWDENANPCTIAVRITVSALRKRLGEPWIIATVPGVGYRIDTAPGTGRAGGDRG